MGFSPLAQAANELQAMIADQKSTPEQVQEKLAALRALKAKAQAALVAAQKELAELLTPEQQALMVSLGYLE